jgi:hypothetical protein
MKSQNNSETPIIIASRNETHPLNHNISLRSDSTSKAVQENIKQSYINKLEIFNPKGRKRKENCTNDEEKSLSVIENSHNTVSPIIQKSELMKCKSGLAINNYVDESNSEKRLVCKICYGSTEDEENKLINPCLCEGTMRYVHQSCLKQWIINKSQEYDEKIKCEICQALFNFKLKIKHVFSRQKFKKLMELLFSDLLKFLFLVTPFFVVINMMVQKYNFYLPRNLKLKAEMANLIKDIIFGVYGFLALLIIVYRLFKIKKFCYDTQIINWKILDNKEDFNQGNIIIYIIFIIF